MLEFYWSMQVCDRLRYIGSGLDYHVTRPTLEGRFMPFA